MLNEDDIIVKAIREYASEGYQITDANGTFIFCNNASSELNGLPLEARLGKSCFELQPEGALAIVLRTGRSVYGHVCSTGNGAIMVANGFPIHDEKGNLVGAISEFTDRTSYVQMAQKLAQNENRLTELETRLKSLTSTESEILSLFEGGMNMTAISLKLNIPFSEVFNCINKAPRIENRGVRAKKISEE